MWPKDEVKSLIQFVLKISDVKTRTHLDILFKYMYIQFNKDQKYEYTGRMVQLPGSTAGVREVLRSQEGHRSQ